MVKPNRIRLHHRIVRIDLRWGQILPAPFSNSRITDGGRPKGARWCALKIAVGFLGEPASVATIKSRHQTNGIKRYRTAFWYSRYPGRFVARNFSSSSTLHMRAGIIATMAGGPHHEPSAIGMPRSITTVPAYIGWRTSAYGPVEMTFWSGATSMVADVNEFSLNTR